MPRNYDTTTHKPYPRITRIEIDYAADGAPHVEYVEQMAVVDGDGKVRHIDNTLSRNVLNPMLLNDPAQIVDPNTGIAIAGQMVTQQDLMLGLLAFLRADQIQKETEET